MILIKENLYLKEVDGNCELFIKDLNDKSVPYHKEYPAREAAVIVVYPDGGIDAIKVNEEAKLHIDYYRLLIRVSPRFADYIRKTNVNSIFDPSWGFTYPIDVELAALGVSVFHNKDIDSIIAYKDVFFEDDTSRFYGFLADVVSRTQKSSDAIDLILNNIKEDYITCWVFDNNIHNFGERNDKKDLKR